MKNNEEKKLIIEYTKLVAENGKHRKKLEEIRQQLALSHDEIMKEAEKFIVGQHRVTNSMLLVTFF